MRGQIGCRSLQKAQQEQVPGDGSYDLGPEGNRIWQEEKATVTTAFDACNTTGQVLELAGGTGNWTRYLASRATHVTVVDAAPEMVEINKARLEKAGLRDRVTYHQADIFDWQPEHTFDAIFAGFFLSHVPNDLLKSLLTKIADVVAIDGTIAIMDSKATGPWSARQGTRHVEGEIEERTLNSGKTARIVKRYATPEQLAEQLADVGFHVTTGATSRHFVYAVGTRR